MMATTEHTALASPMPLPARMKAVRITQYGGSEQLGGTSSLRRLSRTSPKFRRKSDFAVAAALPTAGLTAMQSIRCLQLRPGMRLLIHGAAGAVGSFATQIAKVAGAQVIGTGSGEDVAYLRSLGDVQAIDYKQERFESVGQVDAVLDLLGGDTATRSYAVVKKGGVMVSTVGAATAELAARAEIRVVNVAMKRSAADLSELASVVESGAVKPRTGEVFRLEQAREAEDMSQQGRTKGKILPDVG